MKTTTRQESALLQEINRAMVAGIKSVLDGPSRHFKSRLPITPKMVMEHMKRLRWPQEGGMDTNGWQYDWWLTFSKGGKQVTAFGCGHNGGFEFYQSNTEMP